ncbi:transposase (fragment) [Vibrio tapetis subsp. tapetis]|uniref:Transposase n=1 Tax=Vibrio tapetis subsp. tapetis TaxID=1671868 RepID=A0A2N8ZDH0_9VIBR
MANEFEEFFGLFDEMAASEEEAADQLQIPEDVFDENDINPPSLDTFPSEVQKETLRRIKVINFVEKRLEGGWTEKNLIPILGTVEQTLSLKPPSWRVLAGWKKLYFESGRDIKSLIPKHA